jgi:putative membrane protein
MSNSSQDQRFKPLIIGVSIVLPVVVALLYFLPEPSGISEDLRKVLNTLPLFHAFVNGTTAVVLILALVAIKNKNVPLHRKLMSTALVLSVLFLLSYVAYHLTTESTKYGGEGFLRSLYYFILISHIVLSAAIVPLVLISYVRALASRFDKHKKIARITMPLWIYVAVTGVLVYVMISPYYPFNQ